jgi:hypothetical protein
MKGLKPMKNQWIVIAGVALLANTSAYAIDAKYREQLERSGCTQVSVDQGCDINKTKAQNAKAASGRMPLFAAKCGDGLNIDSNRAGKIYMNGKVAKTIKRPNGQISANSAGAWVDVTPRGAEEPMITYTAKDKNIGSCEILSFKQ